MQIRPLHQLGQSEGQIVELRHTPVS